MPGVPKSLGCNTCRRQKKGCDLAKPACGRCTRLGIHCTGVGVKRFKFQTVDTPTPPPSNESTHVVAGWVHILGIHDIRYDVRTFGGTYLQELPRRMGSSRAMDASISALVASYNAVHLKTSKVEALARYGDALASLRRGLHDSQPIASKIYTIYNIYVCQEWVDRKQKHMEKHREMLAMLLREAVYQNKLSEIPPSYIYGLCQFIVYESMMNARVKLEGWFWEAIRTAAPLRPQQFREGAFTSTDTMTHAEMSVYLREPKRYLYQLQRIYSRLQLEKPMLQRSLRQLAGDPSLATATIYNRYQLGYAVLLAVGSVLNRVLRVFAPPSELVIESHDFTDEAILLARQCTIHRPFGTAFVPEFFKAVWATSYDRHRCDELETLILEYQQDFPGTDYMAEARWAMDNFDTMEMSQTVVIPSEADEHSMEKLAANGGCTIL
ncbi:hypothetical protein S40293_07638 [Stachybotrys chartarum IBT 40293]|nr:hypothetical protein S40293_07638 [Stachybotrys chartarum IBT 40293]